ncbi:molybdopterin-dependent oxidoreductase [Pseudonocardia yunnanensis]|uniref:Molybdopterin-dependent oxidoreductase n=1 Tax=Pseudonocardia yunnanensis TaxID=58107 RepID=A0ABW4F3P3_9PSEU
MVVHEQDPYNAEPTPSALAEHALTPVGVFYGRNHGTTPVIAPQEWRLRIDGMVDRPLELSLADLKQRFAHREVVATLQCAGNRRAGLQAVRDIPGQHPWGAGATSTARWGTVARCGSSYPGTSASRCSAGGMSRESGIISSLSRICMRVSTGLRRARQRQLS